MNPSKTFSLLLASAPVLLAATEKPLDLEEKIDLSGVVTGSPWEVTAAASVALAQGNAESLAYSLQGLATYEGPQWEGLLGADYFYAENEGVTSTDSLRLFGQGQRLLGERFYLGAAASYLQDELADLDYRVDAAGVLGYHFLKDDRTKLSFEFGPGYAWEQQGDERDDFVTLRFAQRFEHELSVRSKVWQSVVMTPRVEDFGDYFLTFEAGVESRLSEHWAWRASLRYLHDSTPEADKEEGDLALLFGLSYALGGLPEAAEEGRRTLKPVEEAATDPKMGWVSTAALGLSLAKGNSDSLQGNVAYHSAFRSERREFFFDGSYAYGQSDGDTSTDALAADARFNWLFNERLYLGTGVGYLRDDVAEVSYRLTPNVLLGYYLLKNETMTLALEGGPAYVFEEVDGVSDNYFALRAAERFTWNIGPRLDFKQSLVVDIDPSDADNTLTTLSAHLDADLSEKLAWRLAGTYVYDNQPGEGLKEEDLTLTSGIAYEF
ncbi:DUF481 domain-containing protein [Roseibacillus ishigakijimensis]|uniref:DUF481 domain-containing protein n=1 Tax=Roseibacillus ishigakijimensis TaxID=454146 RepID=A0A934RMW9_9BACT|nr:DUF481 domain-containing protein [Roseibacillus ishigakijimensis]MBK1834742.1 DUF481 domain-containing protein [Roseibacillus ishigakijimensis]